MLQPCLFGLHQVNNCHRAVFLRVNTDLAVRIMVKLNDFREARNRDILIITYLSKTPFMGLRQTVLNQIKRSQKAASDQVLHCLFTECTINSE